MGIFDVELLTIAVHPHDNDLEVTGESMSKIVHAGFVINVPAIGNRGAREALRRQPFLWTKLVPEFAAETVCSWSPDSLCYFGPSPEIICSDGINVIIHILGVPATTTALLDSSHRLHKRMNARLQESCERLQRLSGEDLKVVGLGAATAIAGNHGIGLFKANQRLSRPIPLITNGNTITAGLSVEIACQAHSRHTSIPIDRVGIVGGFGSVGSRVASMVSEKIKPLKIIISTRPEQRANMKRLENLQESCSETEIVIGSLREAMGCRLSFLSTSDAEPLPIDPVWIPERAVIVDIGKPLNTSPELAKSCPTAFIVDGSLAKLPKGTDWEDHCSRMALPKNGIFGCLAETITLARLHANGELADHVGRKTFIGRPDDDMTRKMVSKAIQSGLSPLVLPAHP